MINSRLMSSVYEHVLTLSQDLTAKQSPSFPILNNGMGEPACHKTYDMVFRCLYGMDVGIPNRDEGDGGHTAYECITLLQAGERLGAGNAVRSVVETHLLRLNQKLWGHVGGNPEAWAEMGLRLQSPTIFREAMIHVIGAWNIPQGTRRKELSDMANGQPILDLAQAKHEELLVKKLQIESRMLTFFPENMARQSTATSIPGRAAYATDIYKWQALTIIRQYISDQIQAGRTHQARDGGLGFYRTIGEGGGGYLQREVLERFHESFNMSPRGKACLRAAVAVMKEDFKVTVEELLVDRSLQHRDPNGPQLAYLTCTEILDEELPW